MTTTLTMQQAIAACGIQRTATRQRINSMYGGNGREYNVVSTLVRPMFGPYPTTICFIVRNAKGKYRRMWLR